MGNWSEQQKVKEEAKEKDKTRKEILAKYFLNLSQVAFVTDGDICNDRKQNFKIGTV